MKIEKRQLSLEEMIKEVIKKVKMVSEFVYIDNCYKIWLNDGWIFRTNFRLQPIANEIRCTESALKKVIEFVKEYEKIYQKEHGVTPNVTIIYDGGK